MKMKQKDIASVKATLLETSLHCPLCGTPWARILSRDVCLDHCHLTGYVRGLLCRNCNGNLGRLEGLATRSKKNLPMLAWLRNSYNFLEHHKIPRTDWVHPTYKTADEKRLARNAKARAARAKLK